MTYNGKEVLTPETFDYGKAQIGDYVDQSVVDDAMDCVSPVCMTSKCAQMGEPYSTRQDPDTGRWRNTFATFRRVTWGRGGIWEYRGHCFCAETEERGRDPVYAGSGEG